MSDSDGKADAVACTVSTTNRARYAQNKRMGAPRRRVHPFFPRYVRSPLISLPCFLVLKALEQFLAATVVVIFPTEEEPAHELLVTGREQIQSQ